MDHRFLSRGRRTAARAWGAAALVVLLAGIFTLRLQAPGTVPSPLNLPKGCTFAPRCPHVMGICHEQEPELKTIEGGAKVKCWLYQ